MNHTPGKWVVFHEFNVKEESTGRSIASCGGYQVNNYYSKAHEENMANARLVAAAPELLAINRELVARLHIFLSAVEEQIEWGDFSDDGPASDLVSRAKAVIEESYKITRGLDDSIS